MSAKNWLLRRKGLNRLRLFAQIQERLSKNMQGSATPSGEPVFVAELGASTMERITLALVANTDAPAFRLTRVSSTELAINATASLEAETSSDIKKD